MSARRLRNLSGICRRLEAGVAFETVVHRVLRAGAERAPPRPTPPRRRTLGDHHLGRVRRPGARRRQGADRPGRGAGQAGLPSSGPTSPSGTIFDVAAMAVGAVPAGIYPTNTAEECAYVINHSRAPVVLVQNQERLDRILAKRSEMPALRHIVHDGQRPRGRPRGPDLGRVPRRRPRGPRWRPATPGWTPSGRRDGATLLYTSGTTGHAEGGRAAPRGPDLHGRHPHRPHPGDALPTGSSPTCPCPTSPSRS